ncbi:MAG TPA: FAD-binding oxidoreductase, partial [Candidatus Saccharimonadales bacterium]|nr:FAD-binding oxidoreductase [Candidatus Saccharimonadales bacterium]
MKSAQITELRQRFTGSVTDTQAICNHFATDGSVFSVTPSAVAYPQTEQDVQAAVAYTAEQAAKAARKFSLTARGAGLSQSGAALGDGLVLVFPVHLNRVQRLTKDSVTVQAGMNLAALQSLLQSHHRSLPAYPLPAGSSTLGGIVADNGTGERSLKYGGAEGCVKGLQVVLDDGSLIETRRLSRRELNRKKGLMTREGDLYRRVDGLIQDHQALIKESTPKVAHNAAGYRLGTIKRWDGSFDLSQLFVGAQGTLGLITEVSLATAQATERTTLLAAHFDSLEAAGEAVDQLQRLRPSALELMTAPALEQVRQFQPELVKELLPAELPSVLLLVEFDNQSHFRQSRLVRRAARALRRHATGHRTISDRHEQQRLWAIRQAIPTALWLGGKAQPALPLLGGVCLPATQLAEMMQATQKLLQKHKLNLAIWGSAGAATLQALPSFDLTKPKQRIKALSLAEDFYNLTLKLGGTVSGTQGDGLLSAP